ncbi:MAG TPA: hypothetical protein VMU09_01260, partial [Acidimicrobiales bacterium]|nr:hypothetical protein [Acidimicrobiales bacterium]
PELSSVLDALGQNDAHALLVALSALLAGGWGPQQLATELIDDLRQVFLAALAPQLCAVSGASLERFGALADAMGLPRAVRTMELLGHALVDMREAPDAQVVLEIALVRAVRPDLDGGAEALAERVGALERALSGDAAFPRPTPGAHPAPPPAPPVPAPPPSAAPRDVASRPSIGAVRRSKRVAAETESGEGGAAPPAAPADVPPDRAASGAARETAQAAPATASPAASGGAPPEVAAAAAVASGPVDRDTLTEAWGDGVLQALPARAKARYASGRFVAVDEQGAHFALPNAAHRDQCVEHQGLVEAALADRFGTEVRLVLVVDDAAPVPVGAASSGAARSAVGSAPGAAAPAPSDPGDFPEDYEDVDPAEFVAAGSPAEETAAAQARLLEAFPGASEVAT